MKSLCIKTNNSNIIHYLLNELNLLNLNEVCFSCRKFKLYNNIIIHYTGKELDLFISEISSILSYLVIDELEENFLNQIISLNYFYFDNIEKKQILENCFDLMTEDFEDTFYKKFNTIHKCFCEYISNNRALFLSGFINFRLQEYFSILDDIVSNSVNQFIIEKEYLEFISLLKLYINSQTYKTKAVHLIYSNEHSILLDENKNIIQISDDIFKAKYLSDISFSSNDYTLNSLLSLLPQKIYIHLINNEVDEFIHTIELVFEDKVELCTQCSICEMYRNNRVGTK